jgi:hypothetical protein
MYSLTSLRKVMATSALSNPPMRGKPRNRPTMCRRTELSRQNIKQLMYFLTSLRKLKTISALSNQPMRGKPRNRPIMCRSTELSRQNIKQLMYFLTSLRKVMATSALSSVGFSSSRVRISRASTSWATCEVEKM